MLHDHRVRILGVITLLAIIAVFNFAPIPQDPAYHRFADRRMVLGVPNFYNVVSNIPFLLAGFAGMRFVLRQPKAGLGGLYWMYFAFFAGIFLTGIGSAYYHLHPDNRTLVWDRLPMTVDFAALFAVILGEYVSMRAARALFVPLLLLGPLSVYYWYATELEGQGDLRPYALVQFLPVLLIPAILWLFKSDQDRDKYYWGMVGAFALAKAAEFFDAELYALPGTVSGHAIKHLLAAVAPYLVYRALRKTEQVIRAA